MYSLLFMTVLLLFALCMQALVLLVLHPRVGAASNQYKHTVSQNDLALHDCTLVLHAALCMQALVCFST